MRVNPIVSTLAVCTVLLAALGASAATQEWTVDSTHARLGFSVAHMVISEVEGQFREFEGKAQLDEQNLANSSVQLTINAASIDTGDAERDKHLRNEDFLDTGKYPKITFQSSKISRAGKAYKVKGMLTVHGVSKEITLDATISEAVKSPWNKLIRAVTIGGKIDRRDFGLSWNKALDQGGVVVGNEVVFNIKTELVR